MDKVELLIIDNTDTIEHKLSGINNSESFEINTIGISSLNDIESNLETDKIQIIIHFIDNSFCLPIDVDKYLTEKIIEIPYIILSNEEIETKSELYNLNINDLIELDSLPKISFAIKRIIRENTRKADYINKINSFERINLELQIKLEKKKKLSKELKKNQIFLNSILENIPSVIYVKDAITLEYLFINKAVENMLGKQPEDFIGKRLEQIYTEQTAKEFILSDLNVRETKNKVSQDMIKFSLGEKEIYFNLQKIYLEDEEDPDKGIIIGIMEDITKLKEYEYRLKTNNMRLSKIFKSSPMPITLCDSSGILLDVNDVFLEMTGMSQSELIGKKVDLLDIWVDKARKYELNRRALIEKSVKNQEIEIRTKSKEIKKLLMSIECIDLDSNKLLVCISQDITEIEKASQELEIALAKQKELNALRSQFTSMVSHEFRTPLTGIILSTDILKRYGNDWTPEERNKHFDRINDSVFKMINLLENVLVIGRLDSGRLPFSPEKTNLIDFLDSIISALEANTNHSHKIKFKVKSMIDDEAFVDINLLGLILNNLLSNAVKYSPKADEVELIMDYTEKYIAFEVKDKGIGIPKEDLKKLFDSFFRSSNVTNISGYGLGLNIVSKCIEAQNGIINVESELGVGTTFKFKIPVIAQKIPV